MAFVNSPIDESGGFLWASQGCRQVSFDATSSVVTDVKVTNNASTVVSFTGSTFLPNANKNVSIIANEGYVLLQNVVMAVPSAYPKYVYAGGSILTANVALPSSSVSCGSLQNITFSGSILTTTNATVGSYQLLYGGVTLTSATFNGSFSSWMSYTFTNTQVSNNQLLLKVNKLNENVVATAPFDFSSDCHSAVSSGSSLHSFLICSLFYHLYLKGKKINYQKKEIKGIMGYNIHPFQTCSST